MRRRRRPLSQHPRRSNARPESHAHFDSNIRTRPLAQMRSGPWRAAGGRVVRVQAYEGIAAVRGALWREDGRCEAEPVHRGGEQAGGAWPFPGKRPHPSRSPAEGLGGFGLVGDLAGPAPLGPLFLGPCGALGPPRTERCAQGLGCFSASLLALQRDPTNRDHLYHRTCGSWTGSSG